MKRTRRSAEQKGKIAIEAVKDQRSINEIAKEYEVHPVQVSKWKKELVEKAKSIFQDKRCKAQKKLITEEDLEKKVGKLTMENDWLKKKLGL
jgi:transposase